MAQFPQTYWSVIQRAVGRRGSALNRIARDYVEPVKSFVQRAGFNPEDAEDLAQEVFCVVCDPEFLKQADVMKGRFRTLVLLVTKNVMNGEWRKRYAQKRKGRHVSIDGAAVAEMLASPASADDGFDREWWASLIQAALERLKAGDPKRHDILHRHKTLGQAHSDIAADLKVSADHVNNEIRAAKKRLREILFELVREYCSTDGEYDEEIAELKRALS